MAKKSITYDDRKIIEEKIKEGKSIYDIADILGTRASNIYYELNQRTPKDENEKIDYKNYNAYDAQMSLWEKRHEKTKFRIYLWISSKAV